MAVNKVEYGDTTLIDLTSDTVTKETLLIGATAHTASGESISGEFDPEIYLRKSGGDTTNNIVTFTNGDSPSPTAWTNVDSLVTGEKHSSLLNKISTMIKNVRFLYKVLGTTDISTIGDGTVTGAIDSQNSILNEVPKSSLVEDYTGVEPPTIDADSLGGKYTANDIEQEFTKVNSSLIKYVDKFITINVNANEDTQTNIPYDEYGIDLSKIISVNITHNCSSTDIPIHMIYIGTPYVSIRHMWKVSQTVNFGLRISYLGN